MNFASRSLVLAAGAFCSNFAQADFVDIPVIVEAPVDAIFAPLGFDNNDNVEVVVRGHFPSTCYSVGHTKASVDDVQKKITLSVESILHIGSPCVQIRVPYIQSVKVGLLKPGNYSIAVESEPTLQALLPVKQSLAESVDDYMYAHVQTVSLSQNGQGLQTLTLKGTHPELSEGTGCVVMKDIKVNPVMNGVLVVQPIAQIVSGSACQTAAANPNFSHTVTLTTPVLNKSLIHVRTTHGDAINYLVRLPWRVNEGNWER